MYVMDEARVEKYKDATFYKNGQPYGFRSARPNVARPVDFLIVAVKYTALADALEVMKNCIDDHTIIMSVMNGITTEDVIGERYGQERVIDTVAQGMDAMKFGDKLTFTKMGELRIGVRPGKSEELVKTVAEYFDEIQMPYTKDEDIMPRMWGKFMLNVGIN